MSSARKGEYEDRNPNIHKANTFTGGLHVEETMMLPTNREPGRKGGIAGGIFERLATTRGHSLSFLSRNRSQTGRRHEYHASVPDEWISTHHDGRSMKGFDGICIRNIRHRSNERGPVAQRVACLQVSESHVLDCHISNKPNRAVAR